MEIIFFKKMYYRLKSFEIRSRLDYKIDVHSGYLEELIEKLGMYNDSAQIKMEYTILKKYIQKLASNNDINSSWCNSSDMKFFPCIVNDVRYNYTTDEEFHKYFTEQKEKRERELKELGHELNILNNILEKVNEHLNEQIKETKSLFGFGFKGNKLWIRSVYTFLKDAEVFDEEINYEEFALIFKDEVIFSPIKIRKGKQQLITYFLKELLSNYKSYFSNTDEKWDRISRMFLFDNEVKTPKQLVDVRKEHVKSKLPLIKTLLTTFSDSIS